MSEPLSPDALRRLTDPASFPFDTTATLEPLSSPLGQDRVIAALDFATSLRKKGYHVFAMGDPGSGRHALVRQLLQRRAARDVAPDDICYVHGFDDPRSPRLLRVPRGRAIPLRDAMQKLADDLRIAVPTAFESEEYRARRDAIEAPFKERSEKAVESISKMAASHSLSFEETESGFELKAMKNGATLSDAEADALSDGEKHELDRAMSEVTAHVERLFDEMPRWQKEMRDATRGLDRQTVRRIVDHYIADVRSGFADLAQVIAFLDRVYDDLLDQLPDALETPPPPGEGGPSDPDGNVLTRYRINVLVEHGSATNAPVIVEDHPTVSSLFGRIENVSRLGALTTDFALIKAGSLHRANGGYLLVDAERLLEAPHAWDQLKRALRAGEVRMEVPDEVFVAQGGTVSLTPEPIALDVKIVFVGERSTYYALAEADPEFEEHVKVLADFADDVPRTPETELAFARRIAKIAPEEGVPPFDRSAVARIVERAAEKAEDGGRLCTRVRWLRDLLIESGHHARLSGREVVTGADVEIALDARLTRAGRLRELSLDQIRDGIVHVDVTGSVIGQINALSVVSIGELAFGRPSRVTARASIGRGHVVNVDREVALTGPIHSKGVLILTGYLGGTYGRTHPLSVAASLVFEQNYEGVEGDSASLAELVALLSAIAAVPVKQSVAVTGAIDQRGRVQAVGGLNEKIEGFFDVCRTLSGVSGQTVVLPRSNVRHLMLRKDVVDAVREGRFRIVPVETVDEAIGELTGLPAGVMRDGRFPEGTMHALVEARLVAFANAAAKMRA